MRIFLLKIPPLISGLLILLLILVSGCSRHNRYILSEQYRYDSEGRLIEKTSPDGSKTRFRYNDSGLPVEINYHGGSVRYGYDADGNRIWMQNKQGRTEYRYDAFDRLIEVVCALKYEIPEWL